MLTEQVSLEHRRRRAKAGSEAEFNRISYTARWVWRWMHQARRAKHGTDGSNPHDDWARGYWHGVATSSKLTLRDLLRIRRALSERVRS